jgi:hypothetical protein
MRRLRSVALLSVLAAWGMIGAAGAQVAAGAPEETTRFVAIVSRVPESLLCEITREQAFQDALRVLASQNEEADFACGILITQEGDSKQCQASFPVRDRTSGSPGMYMELVFVRDPEGIPFVYFDCLNDAWVGPTPAAETAVRDNDCWPGHITWGPWSAVGVDCSLIYTCGLAYGREGHFIHMTRMGFCSNPSVPPQLQSYWIFSHCGCPVPPPPSPYDTICLPLEVDE